MGAPGPHMTLDKHDSGFLRQGSASCCSLHALDEHGFFFLGFHKILNMSLKLIKGKASFARVINMQLSLGKRQFSRLREFPESHVRVFIRVQQN